MNTNKSLDSFLQAHRLHDQLLLLDRLEYHHPKSMLLTGRELAFRVDLEILHQAHVRRTELKEAFGNSDRHSQCHSRGHKVDNNDNETANF